MTLARLCVAALACCVLSAQAAERAPYAGQQTRAIKSLSPGEIDDYLAGKGMGLAKAAELNGYPGPAHVLELATQLGLDDAQKRRTEALFASMQTRARTAGRALVDAERVLDQAFAAKSVTPEALAQALSRIGALQAEVRQVHLEAHLAQAELLTAAQIDAYARLRGYASTEGAAAAEAGSDGAARDPQGAGQHRHRH